MNDKLQQLTDRLYEQGLAKGQQEGEELIRRATEQAEQIVAQARRDAETIIGQARVKADEEAKNAHTELGIAARGVVTTLKQQIAELIVAQTVKTPIHDALTPEFVQSVVLALAQNWNGKDTHLEAILPQPKQAELTKAFEASAQKLLQAGVEVKYSAAVKSGFRIAEKGAGYYISFGEDDFYNLLATYLKTRAMELLYEPR